MLGDKLKKTAKANRKKYAPKGRKNTFGRFSVTL